MGIPVLKIVAKSASDLTVARYRTSQIADLAGMPPIDRARLLTAMSECLRNALKYAGEARIEFFVKEKDEKQYVVITISDDGPGFSADEFQHNGKVSGLSVCKKLLDDFRIQSEEGSGCKVTLVKAIEQRQKHICKMVVQEWINELKKNSPFSVVDDLEQENKQLIDTLVEVEEYRNKLEERTDQLNQANKYKAEFLANMSHEIRTPMNAVIGLSNILDKTDMTEQQKKYLTLIKDAGASLLEIINDILDFSKIEAGKLSLETVELDLFDTVETCVELLSSNAYSKGLSLVPWLDPKIPQCVMGDSVRLRQILVNLINNAIKFTPAGGEVTVKTSLVEDIGSEVRLRFEIIDTGIGLSQEQKNKLFQPFVQADGSTTRKFGGTGLGLSICRQLVDLMKGEIGVDSVVGVGSTFWFEIPLLVANKETTATEFVLPFKRALIVDDHLAAREMVSFVFNAWNLPSDTAASASEALERIKHVDYDLFVIDYLMPEMEGLELTSIIKGMEKLNKSRIILMTAFNDGNLGEQAIASGCDAFLTKPLRQDLLLECLKSLNDDSSVELRKSAIFRSQKAGNRVVTMAAEAIANGDAAAAAGASIDPLTSSKRTVSANGKVKVLLVEDNPTNQIVAGIELRDLNLDVVVAANGEEALSALSKHNDLALIFMDCQMPIMDGYDCTRAIRQAECKTGKHIPIIAMTANAMEGDRENCIAAGMDEYISKPFQSETLRLLLEKCLKNPFVVPINSGKNGDSQLVENLLALDYEKCRKKFGEAQAQQILTVFLADTENKMSEIAELLESKNCIELGKLAHSIKGAAAMIFADGIAAVGAELEAAGKSSESERLEPLVNSLTRELHRFKSELSSCLASSISH